MRDTKHEILKAGSKLFPKHSFQGTGINQVLKECGVPKGSFYHFFPSKEEFALAVLEDQIGRVERLAQKHLFQSQQPHVQRFVDFYQNLLKPIAASDYTMGCLVGTFGQEMAALSSPLRQSVNKGMVMLKSNLSAFIQDGQRAEQISARLDAPSLASYIVSAMQGSIILAKVEKSDAPLQVFINTSALMLQL